MAKTLYFDCFSGASGDMILGALLDLGLPLADLRAALGTLSVEHQVTADRVLRAGVSATKFRVSAPAPATSGRHTHRHEHQHQHQHQHEHHHHSLSEIAALIDRSALSAEAKERAVHLFERLGEAEAAIHEMPLDKIHLHEVGALDSIIDIVGAVY